MNGQHNQAYLNLINQLLFCNGGDATQILRILIQNIDKIDNNLLNALDNWQENHFLDVDNNQAISDANAILDFSNSIKNFPLGDIATNKEL
ncbi:MAG: hypothetical protein QNJ42_15235, partial [Crocosphaera sp.]|nr:hypothetical protein [Crocosphaera sp.]